MVKKRGLGKGLGALLEGAAQVGSDAATDHASNSAEPSESKHNLSEISVTAIVPGRYQPRQDMSAQALEELSVSIRQQGIIQPIVLRPISAQRYEIIAGERRWRAAQLAGMERIPAIVRDVPDHLAVAMSLVENLQRENLGPIESALAFKRLQDEFQLTQKEVADTLGKSRATVTNLLRLLQLSAPVRTMLERGDLDMGHARALLGLDEGEQSHAAQQVIAQGLSVRQTEELVRKIKAGPKPKQAPEKPTDPDIHRLEKKLSEKLCTAVNIRHNRTGKGQLRIHYSSIDELDGILKHIQ